MAKPNAGRILGIQHRWAAGVLCSAGFFLTLTPNAASAVDCGNAGSAIEQAICHDPGVSALDRELTQTIERVLQQHPDKRDAILFDERAWIDTRDGRCESFEDAQTPEGMRRCLEKVYRARLTELRLTDSPAAKAPATGSTVAICHTLLDHYRPLANSHPGEDPLSVLAQSSTAGFRLLGEYGRPMRDASDLVAWAKGQQPPVTISHEVSESVGSISGTLEQAPGLPFFSLSRSDGRYCDLSVFFSVQDGVAVPAPKPFYEEECAQSGNFASLDSVSLYVRDNYTYWHEMTTSVEVAVWHVDHFQPACGITLSYSPRMSAENSDSSQQSCKGAICEEMRKAALTLADSRANGTLSEESLLKKLDDHQRELYESEAAALPSSADASDNEVLFPYVFQGRVFVVRVADEISGGITTPDQTVSFEHVNTGKIVRDATFSVEIRKGDLLEATVRSP